MATVGTGLIIGLQEDNQKAELTLLAIGGLEFVVGWLIERRFRK